MVPTEEREIDGTTFQVKALDLRTERAVLVRLTKVVGPALAALAAGGTTNAPAAVGTLFASLEDSDLDSLVETFRKVTQIGMKMANDKITWMPCVDGAFKNGASSQLKWLWFCLEHQFASFLGSGSGKLELTLESILTKLKAKASPSGSPQS